MFFGTLARELLFSWRTSLSGSEALLAAHTYSWVYNRGTDRCCAVTSTAPVGMFVGRLGTLLTSEDYCMPKLGFFEQVLK